MSFGDLTRYRLDRAEKGLDKLDEQDNSFAGRLGRVEGRLDLLTKLVFAQLATSGGLVVVVVGALVTYLLTRGH